MNGNNNLKISVFLIAAVLQILFFSSSASAQKTLSITEKSFIQAKQVLDDGIEALGGMDNIRRADKITINYKSINYPLGQNAAFTTPLADFERVGVKTFIDFSGNRYVTEGQSNFPGGYKFNFRTVIAPKRSFNIDLLQNRRGNTIADLNENAKIANRINLLSEVPHLLLLYVSQRPGTLRWLGETEIDGQKLRVISFSAENGTQMSLYFDARTKLPARTEQLGGDPLLGDIKTGNVFSEYQTIGNIKIPRKRNSFYNQYVTGENDYAEVKFDFADGEKLLEVPAGFVEAAPQSSNAKTEPVKKMGDGVYLIEQFGYRVMFAEFNDFIVVLEAPIGADVTKGVINIIKQTVLNKPIKYVAFSHFHFDHTGGLREYIAEGVTVVTTPANKAFVEAIAKSKFTLRPDSLALKPRPPVIETFEKKRVFTDGKHTLELYDISPISHVDEMAMFYFPKEKILFQSDMFSPLDAGGIPLIIEINYELVKKVGELKLDVETLVGVHSGTIKWSDFHKAVTDSAQK